MSPQLEFKFKKISILNCIYKIKTNYPVKFLDILKLIIFIMSPKYDFIFQKFMAIYGMKTIA